MKARTKSAPAVVEAAVLAWHKEATKDSFLPCGAGGRILTKRQVTAAISRIRKAHGYKTYEEYWAAWKKQR
jgi:hypothetical protein